MNAILLPSTSGRSYPDDSLSLDGRLWRLPPNRLPRNLVLQGRGAGIWSIPGEGKKTSLPCFVSLQEQSGLGQRNLAEQTTCWSVKPGGIESRRRAKEKASLKEEV